jgi:chemotaxis protein methyltransferase CheR
MTSNDYDFLCKMLQAQSGLALVPGKQYLAESRLASVALRNGFADVAALIGELKLPNASQLATEVVEAMMTHESFFFRDRTPFEHFRNLIIPALMSARASSRHIRIWCAAAATGQEPYSLAMCLKEMGGVLANWRIEIVATDLSNEALAKAQSGVYSHFEVQRGLPAAMLIKYFSKSGDEWQATPDIREMVKFSPHNLLHDCSRFGRFDVVFCRNVLIYMGHQTRADILDRIAGVCARDAYLVLGGAETVLGITDKFMPATDQRGLFTLRPTPSEGGRVLKMAEYADTH